MYQPTHVLSKKSTRQHRNVFIWCTEERNLALGWRVSSDSPITVSTAYRWITNAVLYQASSCSWEEAETFALFPVEVRPNYVMTYSVQKYGAALSRESQDIIAPGDYGLYTAGDPRLYTYFDPFYSFAGMERAMKKNSPSLSAKASLAPFLIQQAFDRDRQCIFSGVVTSCESDPLVATWVFPPFLGYKLSNDYTLESKYYVNPDACDLSELMVIQNIVSGRKDIVALFWENKLGIDVDDNYRIIAFEGLENLNGGAPLKSHLTLIDGPYRPSDRFLRLHFNECLAVSVCRGDVLEDYREQEIELFMEELGVFDNEMDPSDPKWSTPLGSHVHAYLVRQKMAGSTR
ncbi:hypothetical protein BYT27DRAFT_7181214 [Phlegmacium glaucopus]|nr:hypothetical protein BYT27DRAFT_7181214 [Phlegmacium glaucopus]